MTEYTVTELRRTLLDVIRRVESEGLEVAVLRHGRLVARILPVPRTPSAQIGIDRERVTITDPDDDLLETGERWESA